MKKENIFKRAWKWTKDKAVIAWNFCKEHPDTVLSVIGGLASFAGAGLQIYANKTEYEDSAFTEIDGETYKVPCKKMKTMKELNK